MDDDNDHLKAPTALQNAAGEAMMLWRRAQGKSDALKQAAKLAVRAAIEEEAAKQAGNPCGFRVMDAADHLARFSDIPDGEPAVMALHSDLRGMLMSNGYLQPELNNPKGGGGSGGGR